MYMYVHLLLDNFKGHPRDLSNISPLVQVYYLPPNTYSILQPMYQGIIKSVERTVDDLYHWKLLEFTLNNPHIEHPSEVFMSVQHL